MTREIHVVYNYDADEESGDSLGRRPVASFTDKVEAKKFAKAWGCWGSHGNVITLPVYETSEDARRIEVPRIERALAKREPSARQYI